MSAGAFSSVHSFSLAPCSTAVRSKSSVATRQTDSRSKDIAIVCRSPSGSLIRRQAGGAARPQRGPPRPLLAELIAAPYALLAELDRPVKLEGQQADRGEPGVGDQRRRVAEPGPLVDGERRRELGLRGGQVARVVREHAARVGDVRGEILIRRGLGQS